MTELVESIKDGVVLAELGGYGDGPYCARHGKGAAMVAMGTYVVDPGQSVPYPEKFVFKPGSANYRDYLNEHVTTARGSGAKVCVSVISVALTDSIEFIQVAEAAGADAVSLCAYSVMEMFTSAGLGMALCRSQNREQLQQWCRGLADAVTVPFPDTGTDTL